MGQDLGNTNGYGLWRLSEYYKKKCREADVLAAVSTNLQLETGIEWRGTGI